ncbi:MAG: hypothetical protein ACPL1D_00665 [Microgenomates group bacterium]
MDDFLYIISKVIIVIPIVIVILALIIRFNQNKNSLPKTSLPTPTIILSLTPTVKPAKIDLKGPYVCNFEVDRATVSAYIKDKNIFLNKKEKNQQENYLYKDGCLYLWESNKFTGEKICGLNFYVDFFEQFAQLPSFMPLDFNLNSYFNKCQKKEIKEEKIFNLPMNVLFKNSSLDKLIPTLKNNQ